MEWLPQFYRVQGGRKQKLKRYPKYMLGCYSYTYVIFFLNSRGRTAPPSPCILGLNRYSIVITAVTCIFLAYREFLSLYISPPPPIQLGLMHFIRSRAATRWIFSFQKRPIFLFACFELPSNFFEKPCILHTYM